MNIEELNKKHFIETDMYYRVGYGLSSKMLDYSRGILTLEVVISEKWDKPYSETAQEIANLWQKGYQELTQALACKIYIIDTKNHPFKQYCIHRGIHPGYDAKKGVIFRTDYLN